MRGVIPFGVLLTIAAPAHAERAFLLLGNHENFGRVVIQLSAMTPATVVEVGSSVEITLVGDTEIVTPDRVPRNVLAIKGGVAKAVVKAARGARIKHAQSGRLIIIDILDPRKRVRGAEIAMTMRANPLFHAGALATLPTPRPSSPYETRAHSPETGVQAAAIADLPDKATPPPPATPRTPIRLPSGPEVGAVAFRRGDLGVVVFDDIVDMDTANDPEQPQRLLPLSGDLHRAVLNQRYRLRRIRLPAGSKKAAAHNWIACREIRSPSREFIRKQNPHR